MRCLAPADASLTFLAMSSVKMSPLLCSAVPVFCPLNAVSEAETEALPDSCVADESPPSPVR